MSSGDASGQMVGFTFGGGVAQGGVMGQPEQIGVIKCGGIKINALNADAAECQQAVSGLHRSP
ncbi:hypothetical protein D3C71_980600 [compost metagenome]